MADNEDDNNSASKSAAGIMENLDASGSLPQPETTQTAAETGNNQEDASKTPSTAEGGVDQGLAELMHSESAVDVRVVDGNVTQEVIGQIMSGEVITDPNIITSYVQATAEAGMTAECTTVSGEVLNALAPTTTIIYVQPDGSFVESSGLSAEEQQQLIEQLTKQQLVHVAGTETCVKPSTSPIVDVQQVIVSKAQVIAQAEPAATHTTTQKYYRDLSRRRRPHTSRWSPVTLTSSWRQRSSRSRSVWCRTRRSSCRASPNRSRCSSRRTEPTRPHRR